MMRERRRAEEKGRRRKGGREGGREGGRDFYLGGLGLGGLLHGRGL